MYIGVEVSYKRIVGIGDLQQQKSASKMRKNNVSANIRENCNRCAKHLTTKYETCPGLWSVMKSIRTVHQCTCIVIYGMINLPAIPQVSVEG